jgi:hypothetical protein
MECDARRTLIHPSAGHRVTHPAWQLAQSPWLVLDQDNVEAPTTCAFAQTKPLTEQRVPSIGDGREYRFICGMTCVLTGCLGGEDVEQQP